MKCTKYKKKSGLLVPVVLVSWLATAAGCSLDPSITGVKNASGASPEATNPDTGGMHPEIGSWGVATSHISSTINPGDDFFEYVNEGWLKAAEFPAGIPRIDSFIELSLKAEDDIRRIIRDSIAKPVNRNQKLIASMYSSYMDIESIEHLGLNPIQAKLDAIRQAETHQGLVEIMQSPGYTSLVDIGVVIDTRDPSRYILALQQGGLGLPSREYYLLQAAPYPSHREAYAAYIKDLFSMANMTDQIEQIAGILKLETGLAEVHWSNAEKRDPVRMTHYMTIAELAEYAPGLDWLKMVKAPGSKITADTVINVTTDTALSKTAALFAATPLEVLKAYMAFHVLDNHADLMGDAWKDRHFAFHGSTLQGLHQQRSRERSAIMLLNSSIGEIVGQEYVKRHFPPSYREQLMTYIGYLTEAFEERLQTLGWMDASTRAEALKKLANLNAEIGYPTQWHDFSSLQLEPDSLIENANRIQQWMISDSFKKLDEPVRQWEWAQVPQQINAYYSPSQNEIVFLAAILQPPFFDPNADFAVNFGAILGVIGHEMSHGFDDQGSQYDGTGRLRNWWTEASRKEFKKRGKQLAAQYDSYEPVKGARVNGLLTLGENIADLGGISIAYHAMKKYIRDRYPEGAPEIDGFTAEQRFFLAWAQMWRSKRTEDFARELLLRDPHSPGRYRTNGTVRNLDAWYEAFNVGPDAALYLPKEQRITTW